MQDSFDGRTVAQWKWELKERCAALGWEVPQIDQMRGYKMFQLNQLIFEEEIARGIVKLHPESYGALKIDVTRRDGFARKGLAESMEAESEYDQ